MVFHPHNICAMLRCSSCEGELICCDNKKDGQGGKITLSCLNCLAKYCIKNHVPDMLPSRLADMFQKLRYGRKNVKVSRHQISQARKWLAHTIQIPLKELPETSQLWTDVAIINNICSEFKASLQETHEIVGMWGSYRMSTTYRKNVADQMYASIEATSYEKYEDILLRKVVTDLLVNRSLMLVEIGSGVGRILHQYGSCISNNPDAARPYRLHLPDLYEPDSLVNRKNLKLILGIDFERRMIESAGRWFRESKLYDLVEQGRIIQLVGLISNLTLSFKQPVCENDAKLVCILFQTLGNQLTRELQIDMIKKAWQSVLPYGFLFISVFNADIFNEQAIPYYSSIRKSVGSAIYQKENIFLSDRGVFSKWFKQEELRDLLIDAEIGDFIILDNGNLNTFPEFDHYISTHDQTIYKKRAIIAIASTDKNRLNRIKKSLSKH